MEHVHIFCRKRKATPVPREYMQKGDNASYLKKVGNFWSAPFLFLVGPVRKGPLWKKSEVEEEVKADR